jgi:hypothetical protein
VQFGLGIIRANDAAFVGCGENTTIDFMATTQKKRKKKTVGQWISL